MGYKLAGFDVLGGVEIDPKIMKIYRENHKPRHSYLMGVGEFCKIPDAELPRELFALDVLDGSPPCSSFSMAGAREDKWGKNTHFREGQAKQILDDLFFDFIAIGKKLRPKIIIAENVKGLISGHAKFYVKQIFAAFKDAGYETQLFLLNAARMGVPQARERVFFVARRADLKLPLLAMSFEEAPISFNEATKDLEPYFVESKSLAAEKYWHVCKPPNPFSKYDPKKSYFNSYRIDGNKPANTVTANAGGLYHPTIKRNLTDHEVLRCQTFPEDFNFCGQNPKYVMGMSVPPRMMQRLSEQIAKTLLKASGASI